MRNFLSHPLTRGLSIDDPATTELRRTIIARKRFLRRIYDEWSREICAQLPQVDGQVLELGSGGGVLSEYIPGLITSDVLSCRGLQLIADGCHLPFASGSLRAIVMIDVLHPIPDARQFFSEASRCLRQQGAVISIEPWVSSWSRLIYRNLHTEPFEPDAVEWRFPEQGPLSGANSALPWIIFHRDRKIFDAEFASLKLELVRPMMPFRYLVSGGVSMRALMPGAAFSIWRAVETFMTPWMPSWAMFALLVVRRA